MAVTITAADPIAEVTPSREPLGKFNFHTVQFKITGAPTAATLILEGKLAGDDWECLATHQVSAGELTNASGMFHVVNRMVEKVRINLSSVTGGSTPSFKVWFNAHD